MANSHPEEVQNIFSFFEKYKGITFDIQETNGFNGSFRISFSINNFLDDDKKDKLNNFVNNLISELEKNFNHLRLNIITRKKGVWTYTFT